MKKFPGLRKLVVYNVLRWSMIFTALPVTGLSGCAGTSHSETDAVILYCLGFCALLDAEQANKTGALSDEEVDSFFSGLAAPENASPPPN